MAATFNRYAAGVLIASGIALTGTFFWERGPALRGEDAAQLNAAIARRLLWYRLEGTNLPAEDPADAAIKIGYGLSWAALHGETAGPLPYGGAGDAWHGMHGARRLALDETGPLWLDASAPMPADGDVIADGSAYYALTGVATNADFYGDGEHEEQVWELTATNRADALPSAAARSGAAAAWPGLPPTNAPVCRAWHGASMAGAAGDWWQTVGNGATNYRYACEAWPAVALDRVYGGTAALAADELHVTLSNESAEARVVLADYPSDPRATVWRTRHTPGPGGDGDEQHIAVLCRTNSTQEISCPTPVVSISKGNGAYVYFYWATAIPAGVTNDFSFEVVYQHGNLTAVHVPTDPLWFKVWAGQPYRRILVQATNNTESADGLMVYRVGYLGKSYEYVAMSYDPAAGTRDIAVSPVATDNAYASAGATNSVTVTLGRNLALWPAATGRAAKRVDLAQAWNVLTNLTRAARFFAAADVAVSNALLWAGSASTNDAAEPADLVGLMEEAYADAVAGASSAASAGTPWLSGSPDVCAAITDADHAYDGYAEPYSHDVSAAADVEWCALEGCSLPWPCAAAHASGMVARVEIFAVLAQAVYDNSAVPHYRDFIPTNATAQAFAYQGMSYTDSAAAMAAAWARLPALSEDRVESSAPGLTAHVTGNAADRVLPLRLTRVAGATAPAAPVRFDVAFTPAASLDLSACEDLAFEYTVDLGGDDYVTGERRLDWSARVLLLGWLVVADWAF